MRDLDVPARVHVTPVGYERDRVVLPAKRLRADRVVLLAHEGEGSGEGGDDDHPHLGAVRERLDDAGIPHETVRCDLFDFYDCIGAVGAAVAAFPDDEVYVNLASGTKVTAIGGMIACMAAGATPYYVRAERYGGEGPSEGVSEIRELPTYPMEHPSPQEVAVLAHLASEGSKTKKQLIAFGEDAGLPFVADHDGDRKGKYRLLDARVLEPLAEREYVDVSDAGRSRRVSVTDVGERTLRAFAYLLEDADGVGEAPTGRTVGDPTGEPEAHPAWRIGDKIDGGGPTTGE